LYVNLNRVGEFVDLHSRKSDEDLARQFKSGSVEFAEELMIRFSRTIKNLSSKYYIAGADNADILQEGNIGFIRALNSFNYEKNSNFGAFAALCISRHLKNVMKNANRQKHRVLTNSLSLDKPVSNKDEFEGTLLDILPSTFHKPSDQIIIERENHIEFILLLRKMLSAAEFDSLLLHANSYNILEISEITGIGIKSVDNAIQRAKRKLAKHKIDLQSR
jgi:RNA polymerase sporulation-specific sigma factor